MVGIMALSMNEETTKGLPDKRSFEERVFARFDAMDARFDAVEAGLDRLEARAYDTKPIWERALAAITETQKEVGEIKARVETIEIDVAGLRGDYASLLESQQNFKKKIVRRIDLLLETLVDTHENQRNSDARLTLLESKLA